MEIDYKKMIETTHPEYVASIEDWKRWTLTYEGGSKFIKRFLFPYSKKESSISFDSRKQICYNPCYTKMAINKFRDAITSRSHEIRREGHVEYIEWIQKNVDLKRSSMKAFMSLEVIPKLLVVGKTFIGIDAPALPEGAKKIDEKGKPYVWSIDAENVLNWSYDEDGVLKSILLRESIQVEDESTGLVTGNQNQYRFLKKVSDGVLLIVLDDKYEVLSSTILAIQSIPVVELRIASSLLQDIDQIQICLLNLNSSDTSFLWKGNFPTYIQQQPKSSGGFRPKATKRVSVTSPSEVVNSESRLIATDDENHEEREFGVEEAVHYAPDTNAPGFIAPPTENVNVSMKKQDEMKSEISILLDLNLSASATKVLEQSGQSKKMDRIGLNVGLSYVGQVCENAETLVAQIFYEFMGIENEYATVKYPQEYNVKDTSERIQEADAILATIDALPSEEGQKELYCRVVDSLLSDILPHEKIDSIKKQVREWKWIDSNPNRIAAMNGEGVATERRLNPVIPMLPNDQGVK